MNIIFFKKAAVMTWHITIAYVGGVSSSSHGSYLPIYSYHSFTHKKKDC